jgi:hypothetical protein
MHQEAADELVPARVADIAYQNKAVILGQCRLRQEL